MSRIGRLPVNVKDVEVLLDGNNVTVKGPKGELQRELHKDMILKREADVIIVERPSDDKKHRSLHGLTRTLLFNMVIG